jgi:hypothetical protein
VFLSPAQAAAIARQGRQLLQAGRLTPHQFALLDCLLWRCRKHGQAGACAATLPSSASAAWPGRPSGKGWLSSNRSG